ncbi:MerR family transcriptional regulator [Chondromyces crocatus]|uniref:MerR family transcriptional regulator n=1 Tax=Chondromyces crocatus TaxID=52 RepID=A0A0K1EI61_CHOCO|nr:MerR family transcriptional regulator [Chondromyces crocatus]AKT40544.1 MerR family transcriptional regulator [Chondromyces crocatus]
MAKERLTIGELARRTGVPVKTLRFYSDEGLLPPSGRSRGNYRLYSERALARIDLIRTLREAGLGLPTIQAVLHRDLPLPEAMRLRLTAIEAHIASLRQTASALRAALRSELAEHDLRRLWTVTRLSRNERQTAIERFYQQVADGMPIDPEWLQQTIEFSTPQLPDEPTPEQIDAWIELAALINDPSFVESMRGQATTLWKKGFDGAAYQRASGEGIRLGREAIERGVPPTAPEVAERIHSIFRAMAAAHGAPADAVFLASLRMQSDRQDPRAARYWELVSTMNGQPPMTESLREWGWLVRALRHHAGAA